MDRLGPEHLEFLTQCSLKPNKIHESALPPAELDQMSREGLLIKYGGTKPRYAISKGGAQFVKDQQSRGSMIHPEIRALAIKYVLSKGYEQEAAEVIVDKQGANEILRVQADELRQGTQKEVKIPTNDLGAVEIKFRG